MQTNVLWGTLGKLPLEWPRRSSENNERWKQVVGMGGNI
jgi:hypothetical protein